MSDVNTELIVGIGVFFMAVAALVVFYGWTQGQIYDKCVQESREYANFLKMAIDRGAEGTYEIPAGECVKNIAFVHSSREYDEPGSDKIDFRRESDVKGFIVVDNSLDTARIYEVWKGRRWIIDRFAKKVPAVAFPLLKPIDVSSGCAYQSGQPSLKGASGLTYCIDIEPTPQTGSVSITSCRKSLTGSCDTA